MRSKWEGLLAAGAGIALLIELFSHDHSRRFPHTPHSDFTEPGDDHRAGVSDRGRFATIEAMVRDAKTGLPIPGADVRVLPLDPIVRAVAEVIDRGELSG